MGDQDKSVLVILKIPLQPLDMLYIQIVCRLVEEQDIRLFKKKFSEKDLRSLSAAQIRYIAVQTDIGQPQRTSDFLHLRIDGIKIVVHQKILDRSQLLHHGVHLFLRGVSHLRADVVHLLLHLKEEGKGTLKHVADRHTLLKHGMLV